MLNYYTCVEERNLKKKYWALGMETVCALSEL